MKNMEQLLSLLKQRKATTGTLKFKPRITMRACCRNLISDHKQIYLVNRLTNKTSLSGIYKLLTVGLVVYQTSGVLERPRCMLGAMCFVTPAILCILSCVRNEYLL